MKHAAFSLVIGGLSACSQLPTSGPSAQEVANATANAASAGMQLVDVDADVARQLLASRRAPLFSESLGDAKPAVVLGAGDQLEVHIWEAPPATLFGGTPTDPRLPSTSRAVTLPEQMIDREGMISVPFAGRLRAAGRTPLQLQDDITGRLRGKANQPEVVVRLLRANSAAVTVVGEVNTSTRLLLTASGERLLDALAAAGGVRQPVGRMTLQVTRGKQLLSLPLDQVIRDPAQNVQLHPGDVVTALFQPQSFVALGSTGRNEEIAFEAQGISLAQALARAGGLIDTRSNPQGVFLFRLEQPSALKAWPSSPARLTPEGLVPVVYRLDLRNPASFFVMQSFPVSNRDVLYVSNSPAAELQKFLNLVFSIVYPVTSTIQLTR